MGDKNIKVIIETILADKGFKAGLKGVTDSAKRSTKILTSLKGLLSAAGIGIGIFQVIRIFKSAIVTAKEFEKSIANVAAISGGARKELSLLAREAGKTTVFTAREAADAMYFLASAGLAVNDMAQVLTPSLNLATAAQIGIAEATDLVVNNLKVYQASMSEAERFTDIMTKTMTKSNTNMQQLGTALSFASATASTAGVSFEDLNAMIGAMADLGVKGTRAGTQLRMAFVRLIKPTSRAADILKNKYNISVKELQALLPTPVKLLQKLKDANLDAEDSLELFGVRQSSVIKLINDGIPIIEKLRGAIDDAGGTAERVAKDQLNTLDGQLRLLKSAWEEFTLFVQEDSTGALKTAVSALKDFVRALPDFVKAVQLTALDVAEFFDKIPIFAKKAVEKIKSIFTGEDFNEINKSFDYAFEAITSKWDGERRKIIQIHKVTNDEQKGLIDQNIKDFEEGELLKTEISKKEQEAIIENLIKFYEFTGETREAELLKLQENRDALLEVYGADAEKRIEIEESYKERVKEIEQEITAEKSKEIQKRLSQAQTFTNAMGGLTQAIVAFEQQKFDQIDKADTRAREAQKTKLQKAWKLNQKAKIGETIIATMTGAANAYSALAGIPVVGPGLGVAAAALAVAAGKIRVDTIKEQEMPSFQRGTERTKGGAAMLHEGERVIPSDLNVPPTISNEQLMGAATRGLDLDRSGASGTVINNNNNSRENVMSGNTLVLQDVTDKDSFMEWWAEYNDETGGRL